MYQRQVKVMSGGFVPREQIPPRQIYGSKWEKVWRVTARLRPGGPAQTIDPLHWGSGVNALRCAIRAAKKRGSIPQDVHMHYRNGMAYIFRSKKSG
jgi:hypothetical protein